MKKPLVLLRCVFASPRKSLRANTWLFSDSVKPLRVVHNVTVFRSAVFYLNVFSRTHNGLDNKKKKPKTHDDRFDFRFDFLDTIDCVMEKIHSTTNLTCGLPGSDLNRVFFFPIILSIPK